MTQNEKTIAHILEIMHPVLLAALAGPVFYTPWESRVDTWVLPLYLAGFCLIPISAAARIAVRKVHSMWIFLLITVPVLAVTVAAGMALPLGKVPGQIAFAELILGGLWITMSALQLRIRENRRERARLENDITWKEGTVLAEKPGMLWLVFFAIAYLVGLLNACPATCNIALGSGFVYLFAALAYRSFEVAGDYLQETQSLANVPQVKICLLRRKMLAAVLAVLAVLAAVSFLTAGGRSYRDLRKWEWEPVEVQETPLWLKITERIMTVLTFAGVAAALVLGIWRSIMGAAREFAEIPEENGDVAKRLDDVSEGLGSSDSALARLRRALSGRQLTEKEQVRMEYRRAIRKFRKSTPERSETPAEIERAAVFPEGFDAADLHERYEKARYGV